jgi:hypothetical protein
LSRAASTSSLLIDPFAYCLKAILEMRQPGPLADPKILSNTLSWSERWDDAAP